MPGERKEQQWSRNEVGWIEIKDASIPVMNRAEAVAILHRFFLHAWENPISTTAWEGYWLNIAEVLTTEDIAKIREDHGSLKNHKY